LGQKIPLATLAVVPAMRRLAAALAGFCSGRRLSGNFLPQGYCGLSANNRH